MGVQWDADTVVSQNTQWLV